jgi:hypothetical protein
MTNTPSIRRAVENERLSQTRKPRSFTMSESQQIMSKHRAKFLRMVQPGDQGKQTYPACQSPESSCRGGRRPCPHPQACQVTEDFEDSDMALGKVIAVACFGLGLVLLVAVVRGVLSLL